MNETASLNRKQSLDETRQVALGKRYILFSTVRTYLRKIARVELDYPNPVASTGFAVIRAAEGVSSEFLFFQVLSDDFLEPLHKLQTGTSYPAVRARDIFAQPILLPPTHEQERIAAKLSAAFSGLQRAETAARRAQERLSRYRTAVIDAGVRGELSGTWHGVAREKREPESDTGEALLQRLLANRRARWEEAEIRHLRTARKSLKDDKWKRRYPEPMLPTSRDLRELPQDWAWASIDQLAWDSGYGTSVKCTYEAKGPAVLRIPNIRNRALDFADLKFATSSRDLRKDQFVAPGDLLVIRTNGSKELIGRAAVVRTEPKERCSFASYLIRFRLVGKRELWSWLALAWNSRFVRAHIETKAITTAGQYNVSLSGTAIPLPPPAELSRVVREVERRLSAADRLEAKLRQQLARAHATRNSLLREAFTGRLVTQDPDDEPASVLLKRIHDAREAKVQKAKGSRMLKQESKSTLTRRPLLDILREHNKPMTPEQLFRLSGYQQEFEDNECRQEVVDRFYEELRQLVRPKGPVFEKRPDRNTVLLGVAS